MSTERLTVSRNEPMGKFAVDGDTNIAIVRIVNSEVFYYREEIFFCVLIVIKLDFSDIGLNKVREVLQDLQRGKLITPGK